METKEENRNMVDVLNPLASGVLLGRSWMGWWKNLLTLGKKKPKRGLELGEIGTQFFLEHLLVLLALAGWPRLRLLLQAPDLTVGLAIDGAVSTGVEIAIGLSGFSL